MTLGAASRPEIAQHRDLMYMAEGVAHCLLFIDSNSGNGLLVEAGGYDYARNSHFVPNARAIVEQNNFTAGVRELHAELEAMADSIVYKNGMPDFSSFAKGQVQISNMTNYRPTNFSQADELLAKEWSSHSNSHWTASDVRAWRELNEYTWHELNDLSTMQLIPSAINAPIFKHLGGVGEYNIMTRGR